MIEFRKIAGGLGNNMFQFAYVYAQASKGLIPDVYVQDPKYFEGYEEEIKNLYGGGIEKIDMVAIHVRRTDYVNNPFYVDLYKETDYYERALKEFPNEEFIVFSDDPIWCSQQEMFKNYEISYKTEMEDFNLMSGCKGIIGANSSFSWWAAFLNPNPNAKIVFPSIKNWYRDEIERTVCPKSWIRI